MEKRDAIYLGLSMLTIIVIGIVLIICLWPKEQPKWADTLGVWLWHEEDVKYLDFASKMGVNEIYYCTDFENDNYVKYVQEIKKRGMKPYLLCGEPEYIDSKRSKLDTLISGYIQYNSENPTAKFEGIHIDVEPHGHPDYDSNNRAAMLIEFVAFVDDLTSTYPEINFDFDIPAWFETPITYKNKTQETFKFVFDYADRVFVMSYRDSAKGVVDFASEELAFAKENKLQIFVSVDTGPEEDKVTFINEGKIFMYKELNKLKNLIDQPFGLSIHDLSRWYTLKQ